MFSLKMGSRIKKMLNAAINSSSSAIRNNIPSKQNNSFDLANCFNDLVYNDIMAVENKELNVFKKSEVPVTANNIDKNIILSNKAMTLSLSEYTRDTTDWLPPDMVNKKTLFTISDLSDVVPNHKQGCS